MQKSNIHPNLFQSMLDSAPNAARKGQAQYFTPPKWAKLLAAALPSHRPVLLDLTCGHGALLRGAANDSTEHRLGCDIDGSQLTTSQLAADLTLFTPLLLDVEMQADLFVLNPPWDLHWHRERLAFLAKSRSPSVRAAFAAHDGRTTRDTIDSTVATLCIALTLCSTYGEGYLIANASTARRLILDDDAPHVALRDHVWAVLELPEATAAPVPSIVLYFAKDHLNGPQVQKKVNSETVNSRSVTDSLMTDSLITFHDRYERRGAEVNSYGLHTKDTVSLWEAAVTEFRRLHDLHHTTPKYNVWLDHAGHIGTHVSLYDERVGTVLKAEAALLHSLTGRRPMQLVVQRTQREGLLRACGLQGRLRAPELRVESSNQQLPTSQLSTPPLPTPWRIDPDLQRAVQQAIVDYHAARAPLYPLPAIQRLGYLDEEDSIECRQPLTSPTLNSQLFQASRRYPITTQTLAVRRQSKRTSLAGEEEKLELTGQELALFITGEDGQRWCFMEARLLHEDVTIERPGEDRPTTRKGEAVSKESLPKDSFAPAVEVIHFTLQQLVETFVVPEVPDVAAVNPDGYRKNLELLNHIEQLCQ